MKERPILFSGPMVRAILAGRKTQTRRVVKVGAMKPDELAFVFDDERGQWEVGLLADQGRWAHAWWARCPYGAPGDRLWVRETFASFRAEGQPVTPRDARYVVLRDGAQVYADGKTYPPLAAYAAGAFDAIKWRPSIHMPRWASRITLEVVSVRVERLQSITEEDARAEGVEPNVLHVLAKTGTDHLASFELLWDRINGKRAPWDSNPWVWAVEFRRVQPWFCSFQEIVDALERGEHEERST